MILYIFTKDFSNVKKNDTTEKLDLILLRKIMMEGKTFQVRLRV
jgi:hypothetical protein